MNLQERFWSKVDASNAEDCWPWTGYVGNHGYGIILREQKHELAHRIAFELGWGFKPELNVDHLCRLRTCCNPMHLEEVSIKSNVLRGAGPTAVNARQTLCRKGHELTKGKYNRVCKTCDRERKRQTIASS